MSGQSTTIASLPLEGTKHGSITVSHLEHPYGKNSASVASIGIRLHESHEEVDWKVHIPYGQIDALCEALQKAKQLNRPKED